MIHGDVHRHLQASPADAEVTLVVSWPNAVGKLGASASKPPLERMADFKILLEEIKAPMIEALESIPSAQIEDFKNLPQLLVTASAGDWQAFLVQAESLFEGEADLYPNATFRALP